MIVLYKDGKLVLKPENDADTFDLGSISTKINCTISIERDPTKQCLNNISIRTVDIVKYLIDS